MRTIVAVAVFGFLLVLGTVASGDACRNYSYPTYQTYRAPTYHAPTYYAPTYQAPTYYQEVIVPRAVKAFVSPDYYFSVNDAYRDKLLVDAFAGRSMEMLGIQNQLNLFSTQLQGLRTGQVQQYVPPQGQQSQQQFQQQFQQPMGQPNLPPPPQQQGEAKGKANYGPVSERVAAIFGAACARCHGDSYATAGAGLDLRDLGALDAGERWFLHGTVSTGAMPKGGKRLSPEEVSEFAAFAKAAKWAGSAAAPASK